MNGRNAFFLLVLTFTTVIIGEVKANQYRLVTGYLPPWSMTANDHYPGMFVEIMREVDRRLGNNTKIEVFRGGVPNISLKMNQMLFYFHWRDCHSVKMCTHGCLILNPCVWFLYQTNIMK